MTAPMIRWPLDLEMREAEAAGDEPATVIERCEYCEDGWVEEHPIPTPDGPYYRHHRCTSCDGYGRVVIERVPITQDDLEERAPL